MPSGPFDRPTGYDTPYWPHLPAFAESTGFGVLNEFLNPLAHEIAITGVIIAR